MKNIILTIGIFIISFSLFGSNSEKDLAINKQEVLKVKSFEKNKNTEINDIDTLDCTAKVKATFDGVEVDLEITVFDVSFVSCAAFRAAVAIAVKASEDKD
jgi:hypothetical protein